MDVTYRLLASLGCLAHDIHRTTGLLSVLEYDPLRVHDHGGLSQAGARHRGGHHTAISRTWRASPMGVWGYRPFDSDYTLEWLANEVELPLVATIKRTLRNYLDGECIDDWGRHETEAAALLIACTGNHGASKYGGLDIGDFAMQEGVWGLAIEAVGRLIEEGWGRDWNEPQRKLGVLEELRSELRRLEQTFRDEGP